MSYVELHLTPSMVVMYDAVQCDKGCNNLVQRKSSNVILTSKLMASYDLSGFGEAFDMLPRGNY